MSVVLPRYGAWIRRARHSACRLRRGAPLVESEPALNRASSFGNKRHLIEYSERERILKSGVKGERESETLCQGDHIDIIGGLRERFD